nr:ribosome-inactivating protein [Tanacetum cinerariifolium]
MEPTGFKIHRCALLKGKKLHIVGSADGVYIVGLKWIWKNKLDSEGNVIRNEAHLMAKGYRKEEGIDFEQSFTIANAAYARVWLANCVIGTEPRQQWALYGDSNIRLYSDITLCATSNGHESSDSIFLLKGQGSGDERWTFMADGTILIPNVRLVIDVWNSDGLLKK